MIDNQLGYRQSTKGYKHSDTVRSWFDIFFCGGDVAEDIQEHEKDDAKKTYKMNTGYFPGIATIGKHIVYLENVEINNKKYQLASMPFKQFFEDRNYHLVANVFTNILPTTRIKQFIFRFICVSGKWTKQGRQNILKLYTDRPYERLRFETKT